MLVMYLRRLFVGAAVCVLGGAIATGAACSSSPGKIAGTTGGAAGTTGSSTGTAGTSSKGNAGTTGSDATTDTAGTTGAAGDATADTAADAGATAGTTGAAGSATTGTAGTGLTGTAGTTGTAGATATGTAGTGAPVDNSITTKALPVAVTAYWYPSGWHGDAYSVMQFLNNPPIKIENQTTPVPVTTGPCSKRVAGAIGDCFKITYTPAIPDAGTAGHVSVALIPNSPLDKKVTFDATLAPHVPAGATKITAQVAGDVGGEAVTFNLWDSISADVFSPVLARNQVWQLLSVPLTGVTYDKVESPFGWSSSSATPIVFYYDNIRIDNAP